ncbi:MAG: hypothetical protein M5U34_46415 [Chloroflexi bacterium]|nr:hypothetical protein [Chloroflexota bacterium]
MADFMRNCQKITGLVNTTERDAYQQDRGIRDDSDIGRFLEIGYHGGLRIKSRVFDGRFYCLISQAIRQLQFLQNERLLSTALADAFFNGVYIKANLLDSDREGKVWGYSFSGERNVVVGPSLKPATNPCLKKSIWLWPNCSSCWIKERMVVFRECRLFLRCFLKPCKYLFAPATDFPTLKSLLC